ncbi:hypothetical protein ACIRS1_07515 [Kitasatospora sp. NPDC101176]|uniref:hypothetical protein n=1 Tax=Kitasatospora sp. NPDC101176 TaxID=3364099 RepID=UPI0038104352
MNMPGFAAESSLGPPGGYYRTGAHRQGPPSGRRGVAPARALGSGLNASGLGCIPNCVCITAEGCPCCDSGGFPVDEGALRYAVPRGTQVAEPWRRRGTPGRSSWGSARQGLVRPAGCSYSYGGCAPADDVSCMRGASGGGICVGPGYAPVEVSCDDGSVSYGEAPCVV